MFKCIILLGMVTDKDTISELHPPVEVRENGQEAQPLPVLVAGVEVEHERVGVVGEVADAEAYLVEVSQFVI